MYHEIWLHVLWGGRAQMGGFVPFRMFASLLACTRHFRLVSLHLPHVSCFGCTACLSGASSLLWGGLWNISSGVWFCHTLTLPLWCGKNCPGSGYGSRGPISLILFFAQHTTKLEKQSPAVDLTHKKKNLIDKDENGELNTRFILTSAY